MNTNFARTIYKTAAALRSEPTFRYIKEYDRTQWMTPEQIHEYRSAYLKNLLAYARQYIPFYNHVQSLEECPVITKSQLKENPSQFTSRQMFPRVTAKTTSGSTSEPITVYKNDEAMAREQAITYRAYSWAGIEPGMRQVRFWGIPLKQRDRRGVRIKDALLNRIRLSAFRYTPEIMHSYARRIQRMGRCYFYGYASSIYEFAAFAGENNYLFDNIQAIITTSELLTPHRREMIENVLKTTVYDEYGCAEVGTIGHEDSTGTMYINAENLILEVQNENGEVLPEGEGTLIVTELHNRLQPLIRYNLGDIGVVRLKGPFAGKGLPVLEKVHGRARDVLVGPDGKRYNSAFISYIFKDVQKHGDRVRQYQAVQQGRKLTFRIVKNSGFGDEMEKHIKKLVADEFGDYFECAFEYPPYIKRETSGKMRQLIRLGNSEPGSDTDGE